jgi:hypothetical protein
MPELSSSRFCSRPRRAGFLSFLAVLMLFRPDSSLLAQAYSTPASDRSVSNLASAQYRQVQQRLAQGWNTWDVNSMTAHVLLPEGLAVHVEFKHNATVFGDELLSRTSVGQGTVFPGPHAWDGSYTQLKVTWRGHEWRVESAHGGPWFSVWISFGIG